MHLNAFERQPGILEEMAIPTDFRMAGWVYILSNEYMPGIFKVGMTTTSPEIRAKELSSATGVPYPFKVETAFHCEDPSRSEREIHEALNEVRINESREFFKDDLDEIKYECECLCEAKVTDMTTALGGGASQSLSSPQGQIAQSDTEIIAQEYDKLLCLFNQVNPDYATGRFQDGIGQIYFMNRISAQGTVVTATCIGKVGTTIPAGSTAIDTNGYIYRSIDNATMPSSGSIDIQFVNNTTGPIPCAAGALNQIYRAVSGWDAITNISPGVVGVDVESRIAFETRRKQSVARNSRNQDASTLSALLATNGVLDAYVWSNRTASTVNQGTTSFPVLAHSIYICVYGGTDEDVADSIFQTYNPGANLNGDTSYTVYDNINYLPPYPSYVMQWQKATPTRVYFNVELDNSLNPPSDITSQVKAMIAKVFNGGYEGIGKARIGSTINAGKYYAPVISISPDTVGILSLEVSTNGSAYGPAITMGIDQVPTIQESDITVTL